MAEQLEVGGLSFIGEVLGEEAQAVLVL